MNRESKTGAASIARTFIVDVEDRPGVLNRVVSMFRRRNYNIESLAVGRTEQPGISRITLVVRADADTADRIEANLYKLVNVLQVHDITEAPSIVRELAFIKVRASHEQRGEVLVVDCGVTFDNRGLGVDVVHADFSALDRVFRDGARAAWAAESRSRRR